MLKLKDIKELGIIGDLIVKIVYTESDREDLIPHLFRGGKECNILCDTWAEFYNDFKDFYIVALDTKSQCLSISEITPIEYRLEKLKSTKERLESYVSEYQEEIEKINNKIEECKEEYKDELTVRN